MVEYHILEEDVGTLQSFIKESSEYLQCIERSLLLLETAEDSAVHLNDIFHNIHTIKGLSSFVEITEVTAFSHEAESLLDALRKNKFPLTPEIVSRLLDCCDVLGEMFLVMQNACTGYSKGDLVFSLSLPDKLEPVKSAIKALLTQSATGNDVATPGTQERLPAVPELPQAAVLTEADAALLAVVKGQAGREVMENFLAEADEHADILSDQLLIQLENDQHNAAVFAEIFRRIHTLKGLLGVALSVEMENSTSAPALKELQAIFHSLETTLERVRKKELAVSGRIINLCFAAVDGIGKFADSYRMGSFDVAAIVEQWHAVNSREADSQGKPAPAKSSAASVEKAAEPVVASNHSIRVSEEKLDRLMGIVGEMAIGKNAFLQIAHKLMLEYNLPAIAREVRDAGQWVARMSSELEDSVMGIRMTEVKVLFQKFPRVVRDIALQTGKKITLVMEGESTELDKTIIEQVGDPLMHLVRNAADHGVEPVDVRLKAGKEAQGKVVLRAYNRGKQVMIEVEDDGRGMDPAAIRSKAVEKGYISPEQAKDLNDRQALQLIFLPGFSTAKTVSEISGRGVGMDVVKTNVAALKGTIDIDSIVGKGSRVTIQLPLTLAVSRGLLVEVGSQSLILPLEYITETVKVPKDKLLKRQGKYLFYHRGDVIGVASLGQLLSFEYQREQETIPIALVSDGRKRIGLAVDRLRNEMDVLVKPLPEFLSTLPGMGGATILGDGKVALVLNPLEIIRMATDG